MAFEVIIENERALLTQDLLNYALLRQDPYHHPDQYPKRPGSSGR